MKKLFLTFGPLVVLALVLSACGVSVTPSAASVNGSAIPVSELNQVLHDAEASAPFRCLLTQQAAVTGAGVHATYSSRFAASQLSLLVERTMIDAEVARLHLSRTPLAASLALSQVETGLTGASGSACVSTGAQVFTSLSSSYQRLLTTLQTGQDLISAHLAGVALTPAGVHAYSVSHPDVAQLACVSVILTAKRSTANSIVAKIRSGSSFSAIAKAKSIDPQTAANGGALGCVYPGQLAGSLGSVVGKIALNVPSSPIAFGSNYVVLEVTQRQTGTSSGSALALVSSQANAENAFMNKVSATSNVWINSAYGTWSRSSGQYQVVSTPGPKNALVVNPSSLTPLGDTYN